VEKCWEIPCNLVEETFQSNNGLSEQVKITNVEYDEMADCIYVFMHVDPSDFDSLPHGTEHSAAQLCLVQELAEVP
jgi:hypothetical protein